MRFLFVILSFQFLMPGNCWSQETYRETIRGVNEEIASFPGGREGMNEWLSANMCYPQEAIDYGIKGKCYVSFMIEPDGSVANVKVIKRVPDCPECDFEAKYTISSMPKWNPQKLDGNAVKSYWTIPINFGIN